MGKFFKILFNTILILIIILLCGYFILRLTNKVRIYNVETGSMEDKIHTGDYILLVKNNNYHVGDVVTYNANGYFITHRIVKIENGFVITKGDANNTEDEEINVNQIEGKVIYCGGILNFIINYKFIIIAFLIGLYLLTCYFGDGTEENVIDEIFDDSFDEDIEIIKEENVRKSNKTRKKKEEIIETIDDFDEQDNNDLKEIKEKVVKKTKKTSKTKKDK